jgi:hypothetical protein
VATGLVRQIPPPVHLHLGHAAQQPHEALRKPIRSGGRLQGSLIERGILKETQQTVAEGRRRVLSKVEAELAEAEERISKCPQRAGGPVMALSMFWKRAESL